LDEERKIKAPKPKTPKLKITRSKTPRREGFPKPPEGTAPGVTKRKPGVKATPKPPTEPKQKPPEVPVPVDPLAAMKEPAPAFRPPPGVPPAGTRDLPVEPSAGVEEKAQPVRDPSPEPELPFERLITKDDVHNQFNKLVKAAVIGGFDTETKLKNHMDEVTKVNKYIRTFLDESQDLPRGLRMSKKEFGRWTEKMESLVEYMGNGIIPPHWKQVFPTEEFVAPARKKSKPPEGGEKREVDDDAGEAPPRKLFVKGHTPKKKYKGRRIGEFNIPEQDRVDEIKQSIAASFGKEQSRWGVKGAKDGTFEQMIAITTHILANWEKRGANVPTMTDVQAFDHVLKKMEDYGVVHGKWGKQARTAVYQAVHEVMRRVDQKEDKYEVWKKMNNYLESVTEPEQGQPVDPVLGGEAQGVSLMKPIPEEGQEGEGIAEFIARDIEDEGDRENYLNAEKLKRSARRRRRRSPSLSTDSEMSEIPDGDRPRFQDWLRSLPGRRRRSVSRMTGEESSSVYGPAYGLPEDVPENIHTGVPKVHMGPSREARTRTRSRSGSPETESDISEMPLRGIVGTGLDPNLVISGVGSTILNPQFEVEQRKALAKQAKWNLPDPPTVPRGSVLRRERALVPDSQDEEKISEPQRKTTRATRAIVQGIDLEGATPEELQDLLDQAKNSFNFWGSEEGVENMLAMQMSKDKDPDRARQIAEDVARDAVKRATIHAKEIKHELKKRQRRLRKVDKYKVPFDDSTNMIVDTRELHVAFIKPNPILGGDDDIYFFKVDELVTDDAKSEWLDTNADLIEYVLDQFGSQETKEYLGNIVWKNLRELAEDRVGEMRRILYDQKMKDVEWKESLNKLPKKEQERLKNFIKEEASRGNEILPRSRYDDIMAQWRRPGTPPPPVADSVAAASVVAAQIPIAPIAQQLQAVIQANPVVIANPANQNIRDMLMQRAIRQHTVKMVSAKRWANQPANKFPYKTGEYAIDDKETGKEFEGFVRAAVAADPLARLHGRKSRIGDFVSINATAQRYHMIVYKGVPPRALKILCQQIKKHIYGLPRTAHIELFQEVGSQYKILMSAERIKQISVKLLARFIIKHVASKRRGHYVHFVLLQTVPGGSLMKYQGF
jgi:hypothetical protein